MLKLVYMTSGKTGLHSFTFRELELLEAANIEFVLCLTQLKRGMFNPKESWTVFTPKVYNILFGSVKLLVRNPYKFFSLFFDATRNNKLIFYFVALGFYYHLRDNILSIHCQMGDHKLNIGYYLSKITEKKLTVTIHANELYARAVYSNIYWIRNILNYCEKIITISHYNKNELIERLGIESDKIAIMYLYPTNFNESFFEKKKILIVANWFKKKGYDFLLQALKGLNRNDFILWVVGDYVKTEISINLFELVEKYNLTGHVQILGPQPKFLLDIIFSACDIFCLPSVTDYYNNGKVRDSEGIPVSIMEAMRWGKPVVTTKHAGIPELVNQFLVEENNIAELQNILNYLLDNPELYYSYGSKNIEKVNNYFTEKNVEVFINIINKIKLDI